MTDFGGISVHPARVWQHIILPKGRKLNVIACPYFLIYNSDVLYLIFFVLNTLRVC